MLNNTFNNHLQSNIVTRTRLFVTIHYLIENIWVHIKAINIG